MQMVFQDPRLAQPALARSRANRRGGSRSRQACRSDGARAKAADLLAMVGLDASTSTASHGSPAASGSIGIARALALDFPRIIIADRNMPALDVSIQAQVLRLLADLKARLDLGLIFITHDLGSQRRSATKVAVMQRGEIVEWGRSPRSSGDPQHGLYPTA